MKFLIVFALAISPFILSQSRAATVGKVAGSYRGTASAIYYGNNGAVVGTEYFVNAVIKVSKQGRIKGSATNVLTFPFSESVPAIAYGNVRRPKLKNGKLVANANLYFASSLFNEPADFRGSTITLSAKTFKGYFKLKAVEVGGVWYVKLKKRS